MLRGKRPRTVHLTVALLLAVYWAAATLGSQFAISPPGLLYDLWYSWTPFVTGVVLALGVGLYVARWWVLLTALTPVVVLGALEVAGHRSPWEDSGPPLTQFGWFHVGWWFFWFFLLPLLLGVSLRRGLGERGVGTFQHG